MMKKKIAVMLTIMTILAGRCSFKSSHINNTELLPKVTEKATFQENGATTARQAFSTSLDSSIIYEEDAIINKFITDYNMQNEMPIAEISRGNIDEKAYGHIENVRIEMINSYSTYAGNYNVSIFGGGADEEEKIEAMYEVFPKVAKVLSPKLTDAEITSVISKMRESSYIIDDIKLGDLTISYIPPINASRIDIATFIYAKNLIK